MKKIILASQSPRRKMLLEWAEINFDIIAPETDESFPADMPIAEVPVFISRNKARAIGNRNAVIIAADTVVVHGGQIIGKPRDRADALRILGILSGSTHQVITGVVIKEGEREMAFSDTTDVEFNALSEDQIEYYVDKYKPYDKAGAYAIQEWIGVVGIRRIAGDFYNVMGLPVSKVVKALQQLV